MILEKPFISSAVICLGIVNKIQVSKITYLDRYMEIRGWRMPLVLTMSREWDIIENGYVE